VLRRHADRDTFAMVSNKVLSGAVFKVSPCTVAESRSAGGLFGQVESELAAHHLYNRLRERGYSLWTLRLYDTEGYVVTFLPPEFLRYFIAPVFAEALQSLSATHSWNIVVASLMGGESLYRVMARLKSVQPLYLDEPPSRGILRCPSRALRHLVPRLFGDGTEIFFFPETAQSAIGFQRISSTCPSPQQVMALLEETRFCAALLRDSTALEIVTNLSVEAVREAIALESVNRRFHETVRMMQERLTSLLEKYPRFEISEVCERARTAALREAQKMSRRFPSIWLQAEGEPEELTTEIAGFYILRRNVVEFWCVVKSITLLATSRYWVAVRVLFKENGDFAFKVRHIEQWFDFVRYEIVPQSVEELVKSFFGLEEG